MHEEMGTIAFSLEAVYGAAQVLHTPSDIVALVVRGPPALVRFHTLGGQTIARDRQ